MNAVEIFNEQRPLLFGIAYRMLGSVMDAEDVVQEAFLRWERTDTSEVQSPRAYLGTVVTRLSIDALRSARKRREVYVGDWLPEPLVTDDDPRAAADVADSLSTAFLILLESLSPPERAAYLLREVFEYDYAEIAAVVNKTEENCRQLVKRARERVAARRSRFEPSRDEQERLLLRFVQATESGDLDALVATLAEDAAFYTDHGGKAAAARRTIRTADKVARFMLGVTRRFRPRNAAVRIVALNGRPGIVTYADGIPDSVITVEYRDGRIAKLYSVRNPEKLAHLSPLN